jgi:signal transduction histidine kinase
VQRQPVAEARSEVAEDTSLAALAELAAGAAHELNNPLSVISGRAQLLADAETDQAKKRILKQIQENTDELAGIIKDLLSFAEPAQPKPARTDIGQMLNEAVQLAGQKTSVEHINVQIEIDEGLSGVFVDSAQVASAIANVIGNSLESYPDKTGPIKITAEAGDAGGFVRLQISDLGCGVKKATQPFFSGRPAGRTRGMGLAHAQRLIGLNKGTLEIESELGTGTTVAITLACE